MKRMLLSLFAFHSLHALPSTITIPYQIQNQLCHKLSNEGCTDEEQLKYSKHFKLDNDKILLFFHLYKENSFYPDGSLNASVIVDINGKWQSTNSYLNDSIQKVLYDPHNGIWLHSMSKKKEGYSSLYYSKNGLKWQKIKLPSVRTFQELQLCFQDKEVILTFQRVENDNIKAWTTSYSNSRLKAPTWRLMEKKELYQKVCQKTTAYNNAWQLKKHKNKIVFKHKYQAKAISIPKIITVQKPLIAKAPIIKKKVIKTQTLVNNKHFAIQLGVFHYKTSTTSIYNELPEEKQLLKIREILNPENRTIYQLLLGSFNNYNDAKSYLNQLKERYNTSKTIRNAFVAKVP